MCRFRQVMQTHWENDNKGEFSTNSSLVMPVRKSISVITTGLEKSPICGVMKPQLSDGLQISLNECNQNLPKQFVLCCPAIVLRVGSETPKTPKIRYQ